MVVLKGKHRQGRRCHTSLDETAPPNFNKAGLICTFCDIRDVRRTCMLQALRISKTVCAVFRSDLVRETRLGKPQTGDPWIAFMTPRPAARFRLFCFPYAGGGAKIFREWGALFPPSIEVCPIELPGRGGRFRESPFKRMEPLVDALVHGLSDYLDKPFAFFGHSMGAALGFELSQALYDRRGLEAAHLFVSGRTAPQRQNNDSLIYDQPDAEFITAVVALEGTPQEVLESKELLELVLPILRADFELIGTYNYVPRRKLACPITALGGICDKGTSPEDIKAWNENTSGAFSMHMLPGNHFFLHSQARAIVRTIAANLINGA